MARVTVINKQATDLFAPPPVAKLIPANGSVIVSLDAAQMADPALADMVNRGFVDVVVVEDPNVPGALEPASSSAQAVGDGLFGTLSTVLPTAATALRVPVANETIVQIVAKVIGRKVGGANACAYELVGLFQNDGGVLAQVGATTIVSAVESDAGLDAVFAVSGSEVRVNVSGLGTVGVAATGSITTVGGALLIDGQQFVLNDGVNPAVTFEFDSNGSVVASNVLRPVAFTAGDSATTVKTAIVAAINAAPVLAITATPGAVGLLTLANDATGVFNTAITETVVNAGFIVAGMTGGVAEAQINMSWRVGAEVLKLAV